MCVYVCFQNRLPKDQMETNMFLFPIYVINNSLWPSQFSKNQYPRSELSKMLIHVYHWTSLSDLTDTSELFRYHECFQRFLQLLQPRYRSDIP